jgi:hypothetical protein
VILVDLNSCQPLAVELLNKEKKKNKKENEGKREKG